MAAAATDTSSESVVTNGQHQHSPQHPSHEWSVSQYASIQCPFIVLPITSIVHHIYRGITVGVSI
jgi:hypothetical protein